MEKKQQIELAPKIICKKLKKERLESEVNETTKEIQELLKDVELEMETHFRNTGTKRCLTSSEHGIAIMIGMSSSKSITTDEIRNFEEAIGCKLKLVTHEDEVRFYPICDNNE